MKQTMDDKIKNRNSWFKILLISLFCMVLMFKVATAKFTFHFSDLLSFILAVFAIAISVLYYSKVNEVIQLLGGNTGSMFNRNRKNDGTSVTDASGPAKNEAELQLDLEEHKDQLKRVKKVQNEIIDRLMANQDLLEEDRRDYIGYLLQKEKEAAMIQLDMDKVLTQLSQQDESLDDEGFAAGKEINSVNDVVAFLGKDVILSATFDELNQKVKAVQPKMSSTASEALLDAGLVDQHFNITRKGLKEFRSTAKKMKKRA
ncbi:hypothetical protein QUF84_21560 [Fictibacillus enclensis]|uniref:hypothetical protein n=1 Tax=Fictibacillus enclensis TaxID=1017270 RepID=UPI0025A0923A|nr:hypothetical protein [Fictibacillus enclensis]MDM5339786.1 hypothetical protein [Fictibacillus enclensis]